MLKLNPQLVVLGREVFGRWLGHEDGVLMNEVTTVRRRYMKDVISVLYRGHSEKTAVYKLRGELSPRTQPCWHLDLGPPRLWNCEK